MSKVAVHTTNDPALAPTLSNAIASFAAGTHGKNIPQSAHHILRLSLLDWFAVALAGKDEPVSRIVRDMSAREGGADQASVIGLAERLPARAAALVNGTTSHALDYDDTHFLYIGHPSVAVLPAAMAIAQHIGASGAHFLDAALVGVETACRIGHWLGRSHYDLGFHQTATSGAFGAAMAGARLLGLDAERASHALAIAATRASGLKSQFGTMGKPYNAGIAASNGVEAALLAHAGFISRDDGLECAQGFAATHGGSGTDLSEVLDGLGQRFVFESVEHKFHACCHGLHAALEALIEARNAHDLMPGDIEHITIEVNPSWLKVCDIAEPGTGLEAKFSYRLAAALALTGRDTSALSTFTDAVCREAKLISLRDRVQASADASLPDTAARVRIALVSGNDIKASHDLATPLPTAKREAKVRAKAAILTSPSRADNLWQQINELGAPSNKVDWPALFAG
ncbi:MAG: MmgE/PrpD family protein [Rhizobiales bacterium]|nr:MmgE/PrpD family protein [Hyphomicrobiales bacterium]